MQRENTSHNLYTIGEFMKLTHVSKKTLRYYDEHDILRPSYVNEHGARFYSQGDLLKLQQILLLKYLGFSLSDIRAMTIASDLKLMEDSLHMQKRLVEDKIDQLRIVSKALDETALSIRKKQSVDWDRMMGLIQNMNMEQSLLSQYQNASNISARINLHALYSVNKQGWFQWIYENCSIRSGMKVLEIGCGDGSFWVENLGKLPEDIELFLSDISQGMLRDAKSRLGEDSRFHYSCFDCEHIPFPDECFDLVLANHVLFYAEDIDSSCKEIHRVLKPGSHFISSTYGKHHMQEISELVQDFDDRIVLSAERLFLRFGRENGGEILHRYFGNSTWRSFEDHLYVTDIDPLISYILSCHGNQNRYILDRYKEFRHFVEKSMGTGFYISKDAGLFICKKENP